MSALSWKRHGIISMKKDKMITFLGTVFLLYGLLCCGLYLFQERLLFFPNARSAVGDRYRQHEIWIRSEEVELHGWFVRGEISSEQPLIIYYGGNAEDVSVNLLDRHRLPSTSILLMNYRGYGASTGKPSEDALYRDALHVFDHLIQQEKLVPEHVVLMGRSLGSGVAAYVASKRR